MFAYVFIRHGTNIVVHDARGKLLLPVTYDKHKCSALKIASEYIKLLQL